MFFTPHTRISGDMELLKGINVIELCSTVVGPYASQALGALGANVVKVEPPTGDPFRDKERDGIYPYFAMCNCEKRSLQLNLKNDAGRDAYLDLAEKADIIIENFRPGVVDRLGVDYDTIRARSDDIIYCSISGFGEESPVGQRAVFDPMLQGMTGLMSTTGEKNSSPVLIGVALIDLVTGLWSVISVLSALQHREQTGDGSFIDMRMYDVGVSLLTKKAARYFDNGQDPPRMGLESKGAHPYAGYETQDGKVIMTGAPFPDQWPQYCKAINREDIIDDERFRTNQDRLAHREELNEILQAEFETKTRDEWEEIFLDYDLPVGPVYSVKEALTNEYTATNGVRATVEHEVYGPVDTLNLPLSINGERQEFTSPPPLIGEHSQEILAEMGLSDETIQDLIDNNVI